MMAAVKAPGLDWIQVSFDKEHSYNMISGYVGGNIELVPNYHTKAIIYCNEDGKSLGLPLNFPLIDDQGRIVDIIVGVVVMLGPADEEGEEGDLTDELYQQTKQFFGGE
jgi:hypothetical protein